MADLADLRNRIDGIDARIIALFNERTGVAAEIGAYKREAGLPVLDEARERQKIESVAALADDDLKPYAKRLMGLLMEASRARQATIVGDGER